MNNKRGQVTLFIIIAVVILAIILLLLLFPRANPFKSTEAFSPNAFLKSCIEQEIRPSLDLITKQGGSAQPQGFVQYQGEKISYLCYTSENYKTCVVQEPFIKEKVENELSSLLKAKANTCVSSLVNEYKDRGYSVAATSTRLSAQFSPHKLFILINSPMTVTKETSQTFTDFSLDYNSELYNLLLTSTSIVDFESTYGDSETTLYLQYYPNLKIEKIKLSDGSKIYKLTNVVTKEQFTFASRSLSWPPGYGLT